ADGGASPPSLGHDGDHTPRAHGDGSRDQRRPLLGPAICAAAGRYLAAGQPGSAAARRLGWSRAAMTWRCGDGLVTCRRWPPIARRARRTPQNWTKGNTHEMDYPRTAEDRPDRLPMAHTQVHRPRGRVHLRTP